MDNKEIYSDKLTKGKRTYFFDINKSEKDDFYLKVSESKKTENGFERTANLNCFFVRVKK